MTDRKKDEIILYLLKELHDIGRPDYLIKDDVIHAYRELDRRLSRAKEASKRAAKLGYDYYRLESDRCMKEITGEIETCQTCHHISD